jgi:glutamate--cysteine ligase
MNRVHARRPYNAFVMSAGSFAAGLDWLATAENRSLIAQGLRGIEKECLRVDRDGRLSRAPHAPRFGSPLTHPWITTDYSEALLEFVTPPFDRSERALTFLEELHAFVLRNAGDELLWPTSMPCIMDADAAVPIAQYGPSNEGRLRSIYRSGLGFRYGRTMQAIAGTHFNFSLPDRLWLAFHDHLETSSGLQAFKSERLMGLVRNYRRIGWLPLYLYGASPAFCKSFRPAGHEGLESLNRSTWYAPYSTSLRMSDMGYRNSTQARLSISVNSLDEYVAELEAALTTRDPRYEAIGVVVNGDYRQLNANILQLENEYYSSIRPKPATKKPRLISALKACGVEYVEIRTLDLDPFSPPGVSLEQMRFLEMLLIWCLIAESPPITASEQDEIDQRELRVAWEGRRPGLRLPRDGTDVGLADWALSVTDTLAEVARLLDGPDSVYSRTVAAARAAVLAPDETLSARVLGELGSGKRSFFDWAFELAGRHREHFLDYEFGPGRLEALESAAAESLTEARSLEAAPEPPFDEFLADFLAVGIGGQGAADSVIRLTD